MADPSSLIAPLVGVLALNYWAKRDALRPGRRKGVALIIENASPLRELFVPYFICLIAIYRGGFLFSDTLPTFLIVTIWLLLAAFGAACWTLYWARITLSPTSLDIRPAWRRNWSIKRPEISVLKQVGSGWKIGDTDGNYVFIYRLQRGWREAVDMLAEDIKRRAGG